MRPLLLLALVACAPRPVIIVGVRCPAHASAPPIASITGPVSPAEGLSIFGVTTSESMLIPSPLIPTGGVDTTPLVHCVDGYWSVTANRSARFFEEEQ